MKKLPLVVFFILLILAVLIFFNNNFPPIQFITSQIQSVFAGPKSAMYGLRVEHEEDGKIKKENEALIKKLIEYERLKRDNEALRSQFETQQTSSYTLMPARILGFESNSQDPTTVIVDHGFKNNLHSGMAVVVKNFLIGKIGKVSENYSEVILSNNSKFKTLAKTSDTGVAGVAVGNEDFILFDRVSVNDNVNKNSYLLTTGDISNEGIGIPPDLVIGKIIFVNRSPNLPFQTAKVQIPLDFLRLETVFVVEKL